MGRARSGFSLAILTNYQGAQGRHYPGMRDTAPRPVLATHFPPPTQLFSLDHFRCVRLPLTFPLQATLSSLFPQNIFRHTLSCFASPGLIYLTPTPSILNGAPGFITVCFLASDFATLTQFNSNFIFSPIIFTSS